MSETELTIDALREEVRNKVKSELCISVFQYLQKADTESIIVYLIGISLTPILDKYSTQVDEAKALIKTIWPSKYSLFEEYLIEKIDQTQLSLSIQILLDNKDEKVATKLFENLLIFVEIIPTVEELFHDREWFLWQIHHELKKLHKSGKLQQLEVTIASEQFSSPKMLRGDLHVRVSASKSTIVAGQEFSTFVVISNPFEVPIILYSVESQIPIEIVDIVEKQRRRYDLMKENLINQERKNSFVSIISRLTVVQWRINLRLYSEPDNRIAEAVSTSEVDRFRKTVGSNVVGKPIERYQTIDIRIDSASPKHIDSILRRFEFSKRGLTPIVLQPGDSVVKQFIFRTRSWLFFTPLAHKLQIQVNYAVDDRDHLYTLPFDLTIQAEIKAVMTGAVVGSAIGGIARLLSDIKSNVVIVSQNAGFLSILLAIILSAITVVSFARKNGVQQIVSVEDFWGGLFLGFLIGFLGQEFALNLITPNPAESASFIPSIHT
ncbi:hypothetical protein [Nostoc sp. CALU 1950]|uniref:hypothetical protein n=1 Tax=Nostoc sp. CALU 1950 TaxID=3104321 RepID=UPI003EBA3B08